jgi:GNAT superfamily N-acetyltransferase
MTITLQEAATDATLREIIAAVRTFNHETSGLPRGKSFSVEVRDEAGTLTGGLAGDVWGNGFHLNALWLREDLRRTGIGSELVRQAEAHARTLGATVAYVETLSFQARPFYEKHGYRVFGTIEDIAPATDYYFLSKRL